MERFLSLPVHWNISKIEMQLKELLEEKGAKVAGSVSSKTSYLINNDAASASSKNKKARELGVSVIHRRGIDGTDGQSGVMCQFSYQNSMKKS